MCIAEITMVQSGKAGQLSGPGKHGPGEARASLEEAESRGHTRHVTCRADPSGAGRLRPASGPTESDEAAA